MKKNSKANRRKQKVLDATNDLVPRETHFSYRNRLKPRSDNQKNYIRNIAENVITFCHGLPGSGKTHIAVGMAIEYLIENKVDKIIITRPVIEAGEKIGYLPGSAEEKLHPYLLPILDEINHFIPTSYYTKLKNDMKFEIVPLAHMRGRNFHNAFIVADECQNATYDQLKMLLTRTGRESKMVLTGDIGQSDLHYSIRGGFMTMIDALEGIEGIASSRLEAMDIVRNPIISKIIARLDNIEQK